MVLGIDEAEIYVTASLLNCFKLLRQRNSKNFFKEFYRNNRITEYAQQAGVTLVFMENSKI